MSVPTDYSDVLTHINDNLPTLIRHQRSRKRRDPLIPLPFPYMVPTNDLIDGFTFNHMYYWDTFFISLALVDTHYEEMIVGMTENLAHLFNLFGFIPNASTATLLSRSQPPFFTRQIWLAYEVLKKKNDVNADSFLAKMIKLAEMEHETVWLGAAQPHIRLVYMGLSRYYDANAIDALAAAESGWDHTPRCDANRWLEHLPVCLNSILYHREIDLADAYARLADEKKSQQWHQAAKMRAQTMQELMWDNNSKFFFDYDYKQKHINPYPSLAGFYPLWAGLATAEQAAAVVEQWLPRFEQAGGLVTTLTPLAGHQWAWPNGWAPLQWLVASGLERYGYNEESTRLKSKWLDRCADDFRKTGKMWEKYLVVDGEQKVESGLYGQLPGFGWTFAVFLDFQRSLSHVKNDPQPV